MKQLTVRERTVLELLAKSYNAFVELEPQNSIDIREFSLGIHALQNIIASRVAMRVDPDIWAVGDDPDFERKQGER